MIDVIFGRGFPPAGVCAIECGHSINPTQYSGKSSSFSLNDLLKDGILWAVPKHRRTIEKRLKRRFGVPKYIWKPPVPKTNILMCPTCGYDYEAGRLCGHCYERVKQETKKLQDIIVKQLELKPVEKEVVVLYENEKPKDALEKAKWEEFEIVEVEGERPSWFHSNLLQPTTKETSEDTDVKPKEVV